MLMHEQLMSGQFLLDLKNDRSGLLQTAAVTHQQSMQHLQPSMPALDLYSAYAYQQQLLNSTVSHHQQQSSRAAEVLDLSRRPSVEMIRKTPSPYEANSSFATGSPTGSTAQHQQQNSTTLNIPTNLAALYPGLYYPNAAKEDIMSNTPPAKIPPQPIACNNNLLQSFAAAAAANSRFAPHSPPQQLVQQTIAVTTPTSHVATTQDAKNTRPFKAFPRDPLVIAANFTATDVLLDNPRVERYTEYRKRVLEQIRSSNGGSRTITNPKMRRTNSASGSIHEGSSSNNSENAEDSSDCDSNSGNDGQKISETHSASGVQIKDNEYYERRRKNNAAAKKSRDRRRIKEDEIAIRAAYLERQNIELLCQIDALKAQLANLTSKMP